MPGKRFLEQIRGQGSGTLRLSVLFASAPSKRSVWVEVGRLTYPLTVRVVERLQLYNVGMAYNPHNLQLTVLGKVSATVIFGKKSPVANLETLVLKNPFDGSILAAGHHSCLEDDTK